MVLLGRLGDLEDNLVSFDSKIRWVERQVEKAHVKRLTDLREKDRGGANECAHDREPASAGVPAAESAAETSDLVLVVVGERQGQGRGQRWLGQSAQGAAKLSKPRRGRRRLRRWLQRARRRQAGRQAGREDWDTAAASSWTPRATSARGPERAMVAALTRERP